MQIYHQQQRGLQTLGARQLRENKRRSGVHVTILVYSRVYLAPARVPYRMTWNGLAVSGLPALAHPGPLPPHSQLQHHGNRTLISEPDPDIGCESIINPDLAGANAAFAFLTGACCHSGRPVTPHVGLGDGVSAPDAHILGDTSPDGYSNHNNGLMQQLPQRPLDVVAQTTLLEQPGLAHGNSGPIASGSGTGTSAVASPTTAGGIGEMTHSQWTGTLQWQDDMKVAHTQVTAIPTKGNPCALSPSNFLSIES